MNEWINEWMNERRNVFLPYDFSRPRKLRLIVFSSLDYYILYKINLTANFTI